MAPTKEKGKQIIAGGIAMLIGFGVYALVSELLVLSFPNNMAFGILAGAIGGAFGVFVGMFLYKFLAVKLNISELGQ